MGGGGLFLVGGLGKGMYFRFYLNVLNRYYWIYVVIVYYYSYLDSGLFCIYSSCYFS